MWVIIFIIALAALVGISIFISNLKHRAMQHVMKGSSISESNIHQSIYHSFGKKHMEKYLTDHPEATEDSVKDKFLTYVNALLQKNSIPQFSSSVISKMENDKKLEKLSTMQLKAFNIITYKDAMLNLQFTYSDDKNDYNLTLFCKADGETYILNNYRIDKGAVVGF